MIRRRVVVHGLVQGVGFRLATGRAARARGVSGWVCNRADGAVEAVFEGDCDAVGCLMSWCEHGPRGAEVDAVEVFEEAPVGLSGFDVRG